jgi:hypothetical protein
MKRKFFSMIGVGAAAIALTLSLTLTAHKSHASTVITTNIKALQAESSGKCTGPKTNGACGSSNNYPCSDQSGCSSSALE